MDTQIQEIGAHDAFPPEVAAAGFCQIPLHVGGTKKPAVDTWREFQNRHPTRQELEGWRRLGRKAAGIVCGAGSGNFEGIDLDDGLVGANYLDTIEFERPNLYARLLIVKTPRANVGYHVLYRCRTIGRNVALAERPTVDKNGDPAKVALIETRGEGGFIVSPYSHPSVHKTNKPYTVIQGDFLNPPEITLEERDYLFNLALSYDECTQVKHAPKEFESGTEYTGEPRVGDRFNEHGTWEQVLEPRGWTHLKTTRNSVGYWSRPGKDDGGNSATTNHNGYDLLYSFSSNCYPLKPRVGYTKFTAYATLNHGGDFAAAARDLAEQGYGDDTPPMVMPIKALPKKAVEPVAPAEEAPDVKPAAPAIAQHEYAFGEPVLFGEGFAPAEISPTLLPNLAGTFVAALSESLQMPVSAGVVAVLSMLAVCLQGKAKVQVNADWTEPLMLWTLIALPPGSKKSALLDRLKAPIDRYQQEQARQMTPLIEEQELAASLFKTHIERLKKKANDAKNVGDLQRLTKEITEKTRDMPQVPVLPRFYTSDVTPEQLQNLMAKYGGRMAVINDEGGVIENWSGLYSDGRCNIDVLLKGHAGTTVIVDRASREVCIDNPALTICLCVQPSVLADLTSGNRRRFIDNGFVPRFLICKPASPIGARRIRGLKAVPAEIADAYAAAITSLLRMDSAGTGGITLSLSDDATERLQTLQQSIEDRVVEGMDMHSIQGWASKLSGAAVRIAGLFHIVEQGAKAVEFRNERTISFDTMNMAAELAEALIPHALSAFDSMGCGQDYDDAKAILQWIVSTSVTEFTLTSLTRSCGGRFSKGGAKERKKKALELLEERNIISIPLIDRTTSPSTIWRKVNPKILGGAAE